MLRGNHKLSGYDDSVSYADCMSTYGDYMLWRYMYSYDVPDRDPMSTRANNMSGYGEYMHWRDMSNYDVPDRDPMSARRHQMSDRNYQMSDGSDNMST